MEKDELWKLHLTIAPPVKMPKPLSKKEKLYFWWADVKFFFKDFIPKFVCCMLLVYAYLILLQLTVQIVRH